MPIEYSSLAYLNERLITDKDSTTRKSDITYSQIRVDPSLGEGVVREVLFLSVDVL